ncbi:DegT/DnrJ/EryC1/StrS aminotransferase family protein [Streptomyces sp. NBC_00654]|uniref:DegT/DnrJ/EryC1/StrS family aminotransferase n=1 Tax=Streptomyces sp. NBC_00654 TaxID=2975799 RepID=UPI00225BF2E9|nr:DegT/DnrJ/EryC1/StrS aminotransferase family protein [Streptomyces sp. NBC_00654]MCX4970474.1 DegT/DnrJ/EryC1/StrS aminotransferase family protein [Streptomyces sp. NBC_00654]
MNVRPDIFLPWNKPSIGDEEITEVTDVLRSGWLTHGPRAVQFEYEVREALGQEDSFAVSSCTAALHLGLLAAEVGIGDQVITPSLTFCAAPNAIVQTGADPVFVDVDPDTYNIDLTAAEAAITKDTKAIVVMHYGGHPCDLVGFRKLADDHGLILIEDAAHALQASRAGRRAGSVGDLTTLSFYANKVITSGEGGMLLGRASLVQRARLLGRHGIDSSVWQRHGRRNTADYEVTVPGLKAVMPDITAAVGLQQFRKLSAFTARRREIAELYTNELAGLPGLVLPTVLDGVEHGWFLYPVLIDPAACGVTRDMVSEVLRSDHLIGTSCHFKPVHTLAAYQRRECRNLLGGARIGDFLDVTNRVARQQLSLPCYPAMANDDVMRVVRALHAVLS